MCDARAVRGVLNRRSLRACADDREPDTWVTCHQPWQNGVHKPCETLAPHQPSDKDDQTGLANSLRRVGRGDTDAYNTRPLRGRSARNRLAARCLADTHVRVQIPKEKTQPQSIKRMSISDIEAVYGHANRNIEESCDPAQRRQNRIAKMQKANFSTRARHQDRHNAAQREVW